MTYELNDLLDEIGENHSVMLEAKLRAAWRRSAAREYERGRRDGLAENAGRRGSGYDAEQLRRQYEGGSGK